MGNIQSASEGRHNNTRISFGSIYRQFKEKIKQDKSTNKIKRKTRWNCTRRLGKRSPPRCGKHICHLLKMTMLRSLYSIYPLQLHESTEYVKLRDFLKSLKTCDFVYTLSLVKWEGEFIQMMQGGEDQFWGDQSEEFVVKNEEEVLRKVKSDRLSVNIFLNEHKKNIFWRILKVYDHGVAIEYFKQACEILIENCCRNVDLEGHYKDMNIKEIFIILRRIKNSELKDFKSETERKKAMKLLKQILRSIKLLGEFLSNTANAFLAITTKALSINKVTAKDPYFEMCITLNSLMRSKFFSYRYCTFLGRLIILKKKKSWLQKRQVSKTKNSSFDDLRYIKEFISNEQSRQKVRLNSFLNFRRFSQKTSSVQDLRKIENLTPDNMQEFVKQLSSNPEIKNFDLLNSSTTLGQDQFKSSIIVRQNSPTVFLSLLKMEIDEFLAHFHLHMNMNLDFVFSSSIDNIVSFFGNMEQFMIKTFGNAEVEVKIDLMRLVIRMTNASTFCDKLFVLDTMALNYLVQWQTFVLFVQAVWMDPGSPVKLLSRKKVLPVYW